MFINMAINKILNTRLCLKYDTYANWEANKTFIPLVGEVCVCAVDDNNDKKIEDFLLKVGDGSTTWENLPWVSAKAADVHEWAKRSDVAIIGKTESVVVGEETVNVSVPHLCFNNGYNDGDIVFVGFEGSGLDCPIVLGKLFLGASKESENSKKGSIEASNLVVDSTATIPLTTKLTFKDTSKTQVQVANRYSNYKSLLDIIDAINNTEENITVANKNFMNSTNSVVSKVVTEYLSQAETLNTPTKENPS